MNFGNEPPEGTGGGGRNDGRPPGNFPLARQSSVYSLTFDEFQSTMGGIGKDFGSMNMDELLKNIWSAEEMQSMTGSAAGGVQESNGGYHGGSLQRQGSLTLPRTLSQRTVDEVWRDMSKEYGMGKDGHGSSSAAGGGSKMPQTQRQPTLGEVTLEEFLVRAGVVKEDTQLVGNPNNNVCFYGDFSRQNNNSTSAPLGLGLGFQQSSNGTSNQTTNLPLNINGARLTQQQFLLPQQQQQQPTPLLPKQPNMVFANPLPMTNGTQLGSPSIRNGVVGITDQSINGSFMGMVGVGPGAVTVANGSPANLSSDGLGKSNGDSSSVSPVPYVFNGTLRGRKCSNAVEKVVERRQRRMIKNRESAARSRARKQAYTMELEAEVAKLKEENDQLRKKQAEILEMQKKQAIEMMNMQQGKRRCLRRTQTGPW